MLVVRVSQSWATWAPQKSDFGTKKQKSLWKRFSMIPWVGKNSRIEAITWRKCEFLSLGSVIMVS
jgi:hypothetical protein